ncbi:uncharacterized protein LOC115761695 [Drosophila novamexicana]|uniref:uncharacterized protein LOC115761695 n=1 Tax=Drosophila novamexicana TaxID=47314 RepID=UPI0011E5FE47|nr:uncharacterized protein LOC115761695 [Drosophila novamexicana]
MQNVDDSSESEESSETKTVHIERIRIHGDRHFMKAVTVIHEDRFHFDIYVKLDRELGSNYLIMNINLRRKLENDMDFIKLFEVKHMDFCAFLNNPAYRHFFMSSIHLREVLECPIRVGNYSILNISVISVIKPEELGKGTYKFFTEIVEVTGEIPKVFAMQLTTQVK